MKVKVNLNEEQHRLSEELAGLQEMKEDACEEQIETEGNGERELLVIYNQLTTVEEELEQLGKRAERYLQSLTRM